MSDKKQTLVILTPGFAASEQDTTCLPMQQGFVRKIKEKYPGLNLVVFTFQYPYKTTLYNWFGITVVPFNGRNKGGVKKLILRQKIFSQLKKINKQENIIGLLSFWYTECAWIGKKFADKYALKHYCWILGQDARATNKYPKLLPPKAEELVALSDFLQEEFEKNHGVRPFKVVAPGTDAVPIVNTIRDIDILAAGSLIPLKRFDVFLSVVAEIKKQLPLIKVLLIGEGPERASLEKLVKDLNLQSTVSLTGELPYAAVLEYMQRTKVFLHPSSYEGFSGVCMEVLSRGAYVISFCQAMKEPIEQWHIAQTSEEMKTKAVEILTNPDISYHFIVPYSMKNTVRKMMALFTE
jgi:glycosyltransferase involved in cell wall biosynthesis